MHIADLSDEFDKYVDAILRTPSETSSETVCFRRFYEAETDPLYHILEHWGFCLYYFEIPFEVIELMGSRPPLQLMGHWCFDLGRVAGRLHGKRVKIHRFFTKMMLRLKRLQSLRALGVKCFMELVFDPLDEVLDGVYYALHNDAVES